MASRRADPHRSTSDVEWDFSFAGAPLHRPPTGEAQPNPTWNEAEQPECDFLSTGPKVDRLLPAPAPGTGRVEPDLESDFLFVDGDPDGPPPPPRPVPGVVPDLLDEFDERSPTPTIGEIRPAETPVEEAPDMPVHRFVDPDTTDELPRDELSPAVKAAVAATPTEQVPVVSPAPQAPAAKATARKSAGPIKILTVCTHNRTRSVMSMALLQAGFDRLLGPGKVMVRSLGFGPEGEPAIEDAVAEMASRHLHVEKHQSMQVTPERIGPADLILCAEKQHVIKIAELDADAFRRSFTLPEFCSLAVGDPVPGQRSLREWMHSMSSARTPARYLSMDVPEVADPTGAPKREFAEATRAIEAMCDAVVDVLSAAV